MRLEKDWFKMYREYMKMIEGNKELIALYGMISCNVSFHDEKWVYRGDVYRAKAGELITTFKCLSEWTGLSYRAVKKNLDLLKELKIIDISPIKKQHCIRLAQPIAMSIDSDQSTMQSTCNHSGNMMKEYKKERIQELINNNNSRAREGDDALTHSPSASGDKNDSGNAVGSSQVDSDASKSKNNVETVKKKKRASKERITTFASDHSYASIFSNLLSEKYYRAIFDLKFDEKNIKKLIERYELSISELEEVSFQYSNWASSRTSPIKSPRGTLVTFIRNYVNSDKKQNRGLRNQLELTKLEARLLTEPNVIDAILDG